jgi:hypothetical protein
MPRLDQKLPETIEDCTLQSGHHNMCSREHVGTSFGPQPTMIPNRLPFRVSPNNHHVSRSTGSSVDATTCQVHARRNTNYSVSAWDESGAKSRPTEQTPRNIAARAGDCLSEHGVLPWGAIERTGGGDSCAIGCAWPLQRGPEVFSIYPGFVFENVRAIMEPHLKCPSSGPPELASAAQSLPRASHPFGVTLPFSSHSL